MYQNKYLNFNGDLFHHQHNVVEQFIVTPLYLIYFAKFFPFPILITLKLRVYELKTLYKYLSVSFIHSYHHDISYLHNITMQVWVLDYIIIYFGQNLPIKYKANSAKQNLYFKNYNRIRKSRISRTYQNIIGAIKKSC